MFVRRKAGIKFGTKSFAVWHDDIASLLIANHQAVFLLGQVERHQQTQASIEAVLIAFARRGLLASLADPLSDIHESTLTERARCQPTDILPVRDRKSLSARWVVFWQPTRGPRVR